MSQISLPFVGPRYLAFDLEVAADLESFETWKQHRPLGITCAATLASCAAPRLWHGGPRGAPAARMGREEVSALVDHLLAEVAAGHTLVTWNGLGFDLDVLAEESGRLDDCRRLALDHVDMMFHAYCHLGYPLALDRAAKGLGLAGKTEGMSGELAPKLWAAGRHEEVLGYVAQDVVTTLEVALAAEEQGRLAWLARSGRPMRLPLSEGWLSVRRALALPEPDTSWMRDPLPRGGFIEWLGESAGSG